MLTVGSMVRVKPMPEDEFPVAYCVAGHVGMIEALEVDSDGDTAALLWFGYKIPRLHNDGCWVYMEHLEPAPLMEEV